MLLGIHIFIKLIFERIVMRIEKNNIVIRSAEIKDAEILNSWWNDGSVMEHAGFPNGLGQSIEEIIERIEMNEGHISQLCIIEIDGKPVGELNYNITGNDAAYPGWKICEKDYQNKGYGPVIINMLLDFIFTNEEINSICSIGKIEWDTMLENKRAQYVYENKIHADKKGIFENNWKDQLGNWRSVVVYEISREKFYRLYK